MCKCVRAASRTSWRKCAILDFNFDCNNGAAAAIAYVLLVAIVKTQAVVYFIYGYRFNRVSHLLPLRSMSRIAKC